MMIPHSYVSLPEGKCSNVPFLNFPLSLPLRTFPEFRCRKRPSVARSWVSLVPDVQNHQVVVRGDFPALGDGLTIIYSL